MNLRMLTVTLIMISTFCFPLVSYSDVKGLDKKKTSFSWVTTVDDIDIFDSAGFVVDSEDGGNGGGGGVFIGPLAQIKPEGLPFSLIGFGGFIAEGVSVEDNSGTKSGAGLVFVPITFFGNAIHLGYGYNTATKGHVYVGISIGNLISKIRD